MINPLEMAYEEAVEDVLHLHATNWDNSTAKADAKAFDELVRAVQETLRITDSAHVSSDLRAALAYFEEKE